MLLLGTLPKSATKPASISYDLHDKYTGLSTGSSISKSPLISAPIVSNSNTTIKSFSISPALPNGLTLNTTTGLLSGTLTSYPASKAYQFKVTVEFTPNSGFILRDTTLTTRDILLYFDTTAGIDNVKCKFVGTPGGCPSSFIGYTCDASASCSSSSTCSNLSDCYSF
ncbi:putative Ig domain-containing protein [Leptospira terpstrae]|uniref:putative Ig domain-containing protein n=1 Tax=Leptospira terpstrae TaxID=293075 RepID=UPI0009FD51BA